MLKLDDPTFFTGATNVLDFNLDKKNVDDANVNLNSSLNRFNSANNVEIIAYPTTNVAMCDAGGLAKSATLSPSEAKTASI